MASTSAARFPSLACARRTAAAALPASFLTISRMAVSSSARPTKRSSTPRNWSRRLATASKTGFARVFDLSTKQEELRFEPGGHHVKSAQFSPDGRKLATASSDGFARVFDLSTKAEEARFEHGGHVNGGEVYSVQFSPDGRKLARASENKIVRAFDLSVEAEERARKRSRS